MKYFIFNIKCTYINTKKVCQEQEYKLPNLTNGLMVLQVYDLIVQFLVYLK